MGASRTDGATRCPSTRCGHSGRLATQPVLPHRSCLLLLEAASHLTCGQAVGLVNLPSPFPCRGFSYYDAVLEPIVDALNLVLHNESDAWLSLQVGYS